MERLEIFVKDLINVFNARFVDELLEAGAMADRNELLMSKHEIELRALMVLLQILQESRAQIDVHFIVSQVQAGKEFFSHDTGSQSVVVVEAIEFHDDLKIEREF